MLVVGEGVWQERRSFTGSGRSLADIGGLRGCDGGEDAAKISRAFGLNGLAGQETSGGIVLDGAAEVACVSALGVALLVAKALALGKNADQSVVAGK